MKRWLLGVLSLAAVGCLSAGRMDLQWPSPNPAFDEGRGQSDYVQPTASGKTESGLYGGVRSGGSQFHEGLDIKPVRRDRQGEATDPVFAMAKGVVRHISRQPGQSNYGRYVVLEHPEGALTVYSLYAHLASIDPGISVGSTVSKGQVLGLLGRSSSNMAIPKDRAHLHWEIGLWLTRDFQGWYSSQKFGSANYHGLWNGMNLVGINPLDFYSQWKSGRINEAVDFFRGLKPAVRVRVAKKRIPDFVERYPALLTKPLPEDRQVGGWELTVNEMGVPMAISPLSPLEVVSMGTDRIQIVWADGTWLKQNPAKHLAIMKRGKWVPARDLQDNLEMIFGLY